MTELNKLDYMNHEDRRTFNTHNLVDIRHIRVNTRLRALKRMEKYLQDIQNPYFFSCGNLTVHLAFLDKGNDLSTHLKHYFSNYNR